MLTSPPPEPTSRGAGRVLTVQVGSFRVPENAEILIKSLIADGFEAYAKEWTDSRGQAWHVVRVGHLTERQKADVLAQQLAGRTGLEALVLPAHER